MADPRGFLKNRERELPSRRPVPIRLLDWREVYEDREKGDLGRVERQASRCMDCGIPFCHKGCPLGNLIPEWNELVYRGDWRDASERLHATNNFPEFTGRACPAPCEPACVLGINQPPVTIKDIEVSIVDRAFQEGWITPQEPARLTGRTVAVVGSGPAGLAAAQQLTRIGHTVVVFERSDRIGGLLRYGIPEFKLEKRHVERRLEQMEAEGTQFRTGVEVGEEGDVTLDELRARFDAVVLAVGAGVPRDLRVTGRELKGIHFAMEYLTQANHAVEGDEVRGQITAEGKDVIIIGGGDTGSDCLGTALRQGARSVRTLAIGKEPPSGRDEHHPWPTVPVILEESASAEEGGVRQFLASTTEFLSDGTGRVAGISVARTRYTEDGRRLPEPGTEEILPASLVLIAMGFARPETDGLVKGLDVDGRGNIVRTQDWETSVPGVFVAGDAGRGQSLIVWAIAEGRSCAAAVDRWLAGSTQLPSPVTPGTAPLTL
ncbi:glutamate synthase subunit beta [Tessaracoccus oleiagri]|uniref:Glutamate synthase (NADPH/NADH) small chain n=1 Tax=Tessaracoccus oleiagri TaxID=686624 RepID=A0A1G9LX44_9ACTN|nr:glutamate synthase subunit beta [Tessaracoccus oleiagri]SDL66610.1 glutamate synthase (NADPH/NADH) small chain [Tessaracoccus oleiagri]